MRHLQWNNLVQWIERHARADMRYITKNGGWMLVGNGVNSILSLILIVAFANLLSKETYGVYRYIFSIAGVLNIFVLGGIGSAITRSVARGNEGIFFPALRYQAKWHTSMLAAFLVVSGYYALNNNFTFALSFLIMGIFSPYTLVFNNFHAYLKGKRSFKMANVIGILATGVYTSAMLAILSITSNIPLLILTYCISTFIPAVAFFYYTVRTFKLKDIPELTATSDIRYGRKLTIVSLVEPVLSQIDNIILMHFWGPAQLAIYALATAIPNRGIPAIKMIANTGIPKFSVRTPKEINAVFYQRIFQGIVLGALVAFLYILLVPYLFIYALPQYIESTFYSQILALIFIFALPSRYISLLLESQKFVRVIFFNSLAQGIVTFTLYVVCGLWNGVLGLVIARVMSAAINTCIGIAVWKYQSNKVTRGENR